MHEQVKLKPCPFCGGKAMDAGKRRNYYEVCCSGCPAFIVELNRDRAIEAWNRREGGETDAKENACPCEGQATS